MTIFHKNLVSDFRNKIWKFHKKLKKYKKSPSFSFKKNLKKEFEKLFKTKTGYQILDHRIKLTGRKKEDLLCVLEHPEIPLDNNYAEQELRESVIKRKISGNVIKLRKFLYFLVIFFLN